MELTSQELAELYAQIENKSDEEIEHLINKRLLSEGHFAKGWNAVSKANSKYGILFRILFGSGDDKNQAANSIIEICKESVKEFSADIKEILKNNPKTTNYALNVIQLLVPAIAQQYSGIPAKAIVGSITLLCRQGLENFIK